MVDSAHPANNGAAAPSFARLLAAYRLRAGLSQGQLAQAARLSRTYIYHLERGQRAAPSAHAVRALARALELTASERQGFYAAVTALTGRPLDCDDAPDELLDLAQLAALLVANSSYPTHGLDRLWRVSCWNQAAAELFEVEGVAAAAGTEAAVAAGAGTAAGERHPHLLAIVFDPANRARFRPWEPLARRLVADFKWNTATHLPAYKALWRELRLLPDFRRIADVTPAAGMAGPSFVMAVRHSRLGPLVLRTASTLFSGTHDHHIISYVPGDAYTLEAFRCMGWQTSVD